MRIDSGLQRERQHARLSGLRTGLLVATERVDALELPLDAAATRALELLERVRRGLEVAAHLVHLVDEAVPLLLEPLQSLQDLVRRAAELEVVDGLADHRQHREQREWR